MTTPQSELEALTVRGRTGKRHAMFGPLPINAILTALKNYLIPQSCVVVCERYAANYCGMNAHFESGVTRCTYTDCPLRLKATT